MKTLSKTLSILFLAGFSSIVFATQQDFCDGFTEGYKSIKGNLAVVPVCPVAPVTPVGSTDFREGIKAGIRAAQR